MSKLNGWISLDKPYGITSAKAISILKKHLNVAKIGHAGTLDPLASGVLPVAIGEATKTISFVTDASKDYEFTVTFGEARTTDDFEGEVTNTSNNRPSKTAIVEKLSCFLGKILQRPPIYSALKVKGERAYNLARKGEQFDLPAREVEIFSNSLLSVDNEDICNEATIITSCGKGTYIRSIARDLAASLGTYGYVSKLIRTRVGKFCLTKSISLDNIKNLVHNHDPKNYLMPVKIVLDDILAIPVTTKESTLLRYGQRIATNLNVADGQIYQAVTQDELVALGKIENGFFLPVRVFNNQ
jgi:tRNA pseudouridine55 synthase